MRYYPDDVREVFGVDHDTAILMGISFGYEDDNVAANRTRVGRVGIEENVAFKS
jgi:hypothetical protein